ncbi:TPA_asm: coat protein [ssRNA phage SRR7976325_13]|uniref:Coat protein n=1 Tax=ssRNA phage SRR7976325_13 TaxID=2786700 RepID=A0A8S5L136_9VIRU|nr:coat protein [ssRNA phage SRR7976325_13]DAD51195.1 TPA_asm: coat protein [ssRNA phage SRR7976325_13]
MAAIANIVVNDGATTPVAHTFAPAKTSADVALLEDRVAGIYIGFNKLTLALTRPNGAAKNATRNLKLSIKIETPKLETVSNNTVSGIAPAPTISYRPVVEMVATFPERCSLQDRKDLQAFLKNVLANSFVTDAFEKYELPY